MSAAYKAIRDLSTEYLGSRRIQDKHKPAQEVCRSSVCNVLDPCIDLSRLLLFSTRPLKRTHAR